MGGVALMVTHWENAKANDCEKSRKYALVQFVLKCVAGAFVVTSVIVRANHKYKTIHYAGIIGEHLFFVFTRVAVLMITIPEYRSPEKKIINLLSAEKKTH